MFLSLNNARNAALCIAGVAISWVILFKLNIWLFSFVEQTQFINVVFMPAGVRLISVLMFEELAVIGLFIGAIITSPMLSFNITASLALSMVSALNPYIAVHLTRRILKIDRLLNKLRAKELAIMGLFSALFNCMSHHYYFQLTGMDNSWSSFSLMFAGDLLGIIILLLLFSMTLKLIRKLSH